MRAGERDVSRTNDSIKDTRVRVSRMADNYVLDVAAFAPLSRREFYFRRIIPRGNRFPRKIRDTPVASLYNVLRWRSNSICLGPGNRILFLTQRR